MDEILSRRTLSCLSTEKYFNTKLVLPTYLCPLSPRYLSFFCLWACSWLGQFHPTGDQPNSSELQEWRRSSSINSRMYAPASVATSLLLLEHPRRVRHLRTFALAGPSAENALIPDTCMPGSSFSSRSFSVLPSSWGLPGHLSKNFTPTSTGTLYRLSLLLFFSLALILTQHTTDFTFLLFCFPPLWRHGFSMKAGILCVLRWLPSAPGTMSGTYKLSEHICWIHGREWGKEK